MFYASKTMHSVGRISNFKRKWGKKMTKGFITKNNLKKA